jgi:hypothetical protein
MVRNKVLNATFNSISVIYRGGLYYLWRKPEYLEKTTDQLQVTDAEIELFKHVLEPTWQC